MTQTEREAIAYAIRKQQSKRRTMLLGRFQSVRDLRTGERSKVIELRFPTHVERLRERQT